MDTKTLIILAAVAYFLLKKKGKSEVIVDNPTGSFVPDKNGVLPLPGGLPLPITINDAPIKQVPIKQAPVIFDHTPVFVEDTTQPVYTEPMPTNVINQVYEAMPGYVVADTPVIDPVAPGKQLNIVSGIRRNLGMASIC